MSTKPVSTNAYERLAPGQVIGLFLARLFAYLMRLETSGETIVRSDIGQLIASAEGLVQSYIRMRASEQLERAGFSDDGHAMRTTTRLCSREPAVHAERSQGCGPYTPAELIARLKPAIEQFERADAIADRLARIILCAICVLTPETREAPVYARLTSQIHRMGFSPISMTPTSRDPPDTWPPPVRIATSQFLPPPVIPGEDPGPRYSMAVDGLGPG